MDLHDRVLRAALFFAIGLGIALGMHRLVRQRDAAAQARVDQADREALLQASLAIVADALVVVDDAGRIQSFSNAAQRLFGWNADEVLGRTFALLMPPGEALALNAAAADDEMSGSARQVVGLSRDGAQFPMELRIGEATTGAGRRFLTIVVRDLSSMQEAERRSEDLRAQLTQV